MKRLCAAAFVLAALATSAAAEEGRPLTMEAIDRVIESVDRSVQACSAGGGRRAARAVLMRLEIDADGRVTAAQPAEKPSRETECLARVARRLTFPSTGVTTNVHYPFMLV